MLYSVTPELLKLPGQSLRSSRTIDACKFYGRFNEEFAFQKNLMSERDGDMGHLDNFRCHVYGLTEPCGFPVLNINMHNHEEVIIMMILRYINPLFSEKFCPCTFEIPEVVRVVDDPSCIRVFIVYFYPYPMCRLCLRSSISE